MAIVAKGLTHRIVAPAFVGSSPISRPIRKYVEASASLLLNISKRFHYLIV